jgi:pimeloyl-ACP methyl ester carboxylesterase
MATVDLPHGTLHYHEAGSGVPIVFLHGYLMDANLWDPVSSSWKASSAASPRSCPSVPTRPRCAPTPT